MTSSASANPGLSALIADLERRLTELRFLEVVEKVEHVPYQSGDQFWVRFIRPFDLGRINDVVTKHGYTIVKFASVPSKLPRGLAELLWSGITHVVVEKISDWSRFTSNFGFEPDGIAKLAVDLHGPYWLFIATEEKGIQLLYEYLELKYAPPSAPPPNPVTATKSPAPPLTKPVQPPAPMPNTPATPSIANPQH